jgi:D-alanyl-D-alanine dipeptidase
MAALNRVEIAEQALPWPQREPLVDIRTACSSPFVDVAPRACPFLRRTVAEMLLAARAALPDGYGLRATTAMRTLAMQRAYWDGYFRQMKADHPDWPLPALRRATNRFFAPYDQKAPPGHCTGGAVDVHLLDAAGERLDVTSPLEGWKAAPTWTAGLSREAKTNRMILVEAMLTAGFSNCRDEYWHYSYGDSAWAVRTGAASCPYGWTYPPVAVVLNPETDRAVELPIEPERDADGRPTHAGIAIAAAGSADLDGWATVPGDPADEEGAWRIGVFWAAGVPLTLRLQGGAAISGVVSVTVDAFSEQSEPETLEAGEHGERILRITPAEDRIRLTLRTR